MNPLWRSFLAAWRNLGKRRALSQGGRRGPLVMEALEDRLVRSTAHLPELPMLTPPPSNWVGAFGTHTDVSTQAASFQWGQPAPGGHGPAPVNNGFWAWPGGQGFAASTNCFSARCATDNLHGNPGAAGLASSDASAATEAAAYDAFYTGGPGWHGQINAVILLVV
jgi:hypothetical protein